MADLKLELSGVRWAVARVKALVAEAMVVDGM